MKQGGLRHEDELHHFAEYLGVEGERARLFLWQFLAQRLTPEPEGWVAPYSKQAVVIWWTPAGVC